MNFAIARTIKKKPLCGWCHCRKVAWKKNKCKIQKLLYARQDKEARYLDIAHVEGMIAAGPLYLLKHDAGDELQLLGAALVP